MWNIRRMCDWCWCQRKFGSLSPGKAEEERPIAGAGNLVGCFAKVFINVLLIIIFRTPSPFFLQGQVFLKGGGGLALFLFNFFKVYHFYIQKLRFSLQNCVTHSKKKKFICHYNFMKKVIRSCLKMIPKISYQLR